MPKFRRKHDPLPELVISEYMRLFCKHVGITEQFMRERPDNPLFLMMSLYSDVPNYIQRSGFKGDRDMYISMLETFNNSVFPAETRKKMYQFFNNSNPDLSGF